MNPPVFVYILSGIDSNGEKKELKFGKRFLHLAEVKKML